MKKAHPSSRVLYMDNIRYRKALLKKMRVIIPTLEYEANQAVIKVLDDRDEANKLAQEINRLTNERIDLCGK